MTTNNAVCHHPNFKIEIVNDCQRRKRGPSSCDEGYEADTLFSPISMNASTAVEESHGVISWRPGQIQKERVPPKKMREETRETRSGNDGLKDSEQLPATSLWGSGDDGALRRGRRSESPSLQTGGRRDSITDSGLCSGGSVLVLDSWDVGRYEDAEGISPIGPPIFESSLCCESGEPLRDLPGTSSDFIDHDTTREDDDGDTSYDTTLPLNVKVKSVVVVCQPHTTSFKPDCPVLEQNLATVDGAASTGSQRAAALRTELSWKREKNQYVNLVTKHINGKADNQDVMTELLSLMTQVADQTPGGGAPWQHPSNLTRRNYQGRFDLSTPKMSLQEWQDKNHATYQRFASVPGVFERSPVP